MAYWIPIQKLYWLLTGLGMEINSSYSIVYNSGTIARTSWREYYFSIHFINFLLWGFKEHYIICDV